MHKLGWMGVLAVALVGCGADGGGGGGERVRDLADRDGGPDDSRDEDAGPPDPPDGERTAEVGLASERAAAVTAAAELVSVFTAQGEPTLDLAADGCANMENVSAQITAMVGGGDSGCLALTPSCENGTGTLQAVFTVCMLPTGSLLSGTVTASIGSDDASGTTVVSVALQLDGVTLESLESEEAYTLSGAVTVSTSDLTRYGLKTELDYSDYALTFDGTLALLESDTGVPEGAGLDGEGTLSTAAASLELAGWACQGDALSYSLEAFQRSFAECRADAGTLTFVGALACTKQVGGKTVESEATLTDEVAFAETTPETSIVHVTTTLKVGEQESQTEMDVTLPGECP